ncbi:transglutaminase domain-containing protein [Candidatus Acetatifactor stercoripullorum]|uniref:transglutaminase domain-containing protein n=1 Tax=Candidatus Acetatifactor stercoripullorum TaxID=2838414 RepID=UPI00298E2064|nr:transglutaminase domain-containing protein [Candidatus Acetatifactor stercoripullorum]
MKKGALTGRFVLLLFLLVLLWTGCAASELFWEGGAGETASLEAALENPQTAVPKQEETDAQPPGETQASGESGEETVSFLWEGASFVSHFAFDSLTDAQKQWYRDIEKSLGAMEETARLSQEGIEAGLDETCIDQIFQCVLIDHPELFYVEGYTYTKYERGGSLLAIDFSGTYSMDSQSALTRKEAIEAGAAVYLSGIAAESSEYEKVKYVYETLIRNTDYDLNSVDNQNIYSVFVNHLSVCQGYAKAAQYLLNRLGVECTLVMGTVDTGEGHAWNLVKVDGSYYYVDATWGDASYRLESPEGVEDAHMPDINYDYLCVTTRELLRTHTLGGVVPMPECTAVEANYYVREGALFTSYDREQMKALFDRAASQGKSDVTVKCSDSACFQEILSALIEGQEIFDYLSSESGTIAYAHNEKQLSLTFWVTNEQ